MVWLTFLTAVIGLPVIVAGLLGAGDRSLQWAPRLWARLLMIGIACRAKIKGLKNLEAGATYVFAGNHTSALDIPALQSVLPKNFRWIAKKELFSIVVFGPALRAVGGIPIDRSAGRQALQSLLEASRKVEKDASVLIFPEGTRSEDGVLLPFKSGGFLLAIKSQRPVVPFFMYGARHALANDRFLLDPGPIRVICGEPISTEGYSAGDREMLARTVRKRILDLQRGLEPELVDRAEEAA